MKQTYLLFLLIILNSCGPEYDQDKLVGQWTINSVQDITTGKLAPDKLNEGSLWVFKSNDSVNIEFKNNPLWNSQDHGTYKLNRDQLILMMDKDTLTVKMEELGDGELTFLQKGRLRFILKKVNHEDVNHD